MTQRANVTVMPRHTTLTGILSPADKAINQYTTVPIVPSLHNYHWVLVNTSAGKDSQAMMDKIHKLAIRSGYPLSRIIAVHCDLGRSEWADTKELAEDQATHYGFRFIVVKADRDLLERIEARGKWPDAQVRYCTSEFKRAPVQKLMTALTKQTRDEHEAKHGRSVPKPRVRILNCMGMRAQESPKRRDMVPFAPDAETTFSYKGILDKNSRRNVDKWLPIDSWSTDEVWATIHKSGVAYHEAYDLGMPRLSCAFCVFATEAPLLIAGYHNRALLKDYVDAERRMNHSFQKGKPLINIQLKLESGYVPQGKVSDHEWAQCA